MPVNLAAPYPAPVPTSSAITKLIAPFHESLAKRPMAGRGTGEEGNQHEAQVTVRRSRDSRSFAAAWGAFRAMHGSCSCRGSN